MPLLFLLLSTIATAASESARSAADSPVPIAAVVDEVHRILANCRQTEYSHKTQIDEKAGRYVTDCSGLAGYVLKRRLPEHFARMTASMGTSRPLARDFHAWFAAAPVEGPFPAGWRQVKQILDARPGDFIAWRNPQPKPGSTGHVVIVDGLPEKTADGQVRLAIVDSNSSSHADDTRKPGETGVGRGVMWFAVDREGRPIGCRSKSPTGKLGERPTAIGRPVPMESDTASRKKPGASRPARKTTVTIEGDAFHINGRSTYAGRTWKGKRIEGLLMNARLVQGIFDDLNPATRGRWAYPDTGRWDPDRNTREFVAAMPEWRKHGLLCFTINLQGGSPQGYSREQPWHNSAITPEGSLRPEHLARLEKILDRADELGMAVILGVFYFGQDQRLKDEAAVVRALDAACDWVQDRGYRNVLIEINNECNVDYDHPVLRPERVHELIERVKRRSQREGRPRLLASTSYGGGAVPRENVVRAADFLLMHGNGVSRPERIAEMVRQARQVPGYRKMPILVNEDDHFDFDRPSNNLLAAVSEYCSWGYFDPGKSNYQDGYQCPPVHWGLSTPRKKAFFATVKEITGDNAR